MSLVSKTYIFSATHQGLYTCSCFHVGVTHHNELSHSSSAS